MSLLLRHCYIPLNLQSIYNTEDRILWTGEKKIVLYIWRSQRQSTKREQIHFRLCRQTGMKTVQFACGNYEGNIRKTNRLAKRLQLKYIVCKLFHSQVIGENNQFETNFITKWWRYRPWTLPVGPESELQNEKA